MVTLRAYMPWLRRKWKIILAIVMSWGTASLLVWSGVNVVLQTLLLAVGTSLLIEMLLELATREAFINLLDERLKLQEDVHELGIERIYREGQGGLEEIKELLKTAARLDFLALSGGTAIPALEENFRAALERGCHIRVLLCEEDSSFVHDREEQEGSGRQGQIRHEIDRSLRGVLHKITMDQGRRGCLEVKTHPYAIYSNLVVASGHHGEPFRLLHVPYMIPTAARFAPMFVYGAHQSSCETMTRYLEGFEALWKKSRLRIRHDCRINEHVCDVGSVECRAREPEQTHVSA